MKQAKPKLNLNVTTTLRQVFMVRMEQVAYLCELVEITTPPYQEGNGWIRYSYRSSLIDQEQGPQALPGKAFVQEGQKNEFRNERQYCTDDKSGLLHTVRYFFGNVSDVVEGNSLLHGE